MDTITLRKRCKRLMIDCGLDLRGGQTLLAESLSMNRNSISMALSGYRNGPGSLQILQAIRKHLLQTQKQGAGEQGEKSLLGA